MKAVIFYEFRKDGALRRRFKQGPEELYMEHPRDILFSLKRDRQAIRKEREKRVSRIKNAIVVSAKLPRNNIIAVMH